MTITSPLAPSQAQEPPSESSTNQSLQVPLERPLWGESSSGYSPDSHWTTNGTLIIRYQRPFQDQVATTGEFDFPNYWIMALTYQLAYALAPDYGLDPTQRGFLNKDMKELVDEALGFGTEEGSFNIQPRIKQ